MYILYHKTSNQLVPSKWNDTCRTYVTEFTPDLSDWIAYHTPLISWFWVFSGLCASNVCTPFRHSYAFYAKIYNICSSEYRMKKMLLCGFHWYSRYSRLYLDFYICVNAYRVCPGSSCGFKMY